MVLVAAATAVVLLATAGGVALALTRGDGGNQAGDDPTPSGSTGPSTSQSATGGPVLPADEQCTPEIKANTRWVCLTRATLADNQLTIEYEAEFGDSQPNVNGGFHLHIYGGDGTTPADETMGNQAADPGAWIVEDKNPSRLRTTTAQYRQAIGDAPKVCARIANSSHELVEDDDGTFKTGNCVPISR
jgi:hypothetical protein